MAITFLAWVSERHCCPTSVRKPQVSINRFTVLMLHFRRTVNSSRLTLSSPQENQIPKVFISYAHEDLEFACRLYKRLKAIPGVEPCSTKKGYFPEWEGLC